ncbi:MAG: 4Fe-4S binding protein [Candidatus Alkanophagales archaeon]
MDRCDGCGRCVEVCPSGVLEPVPTTTGRSSYVLKKNS